jgi:hypothetical protein
MVPTISRVGLMYRWASISITFFGILVIFFATLDAIRAQLTTLETMPLTSFERQSVAEFARQEQRLRTALDALTTAIAEEPSPADSAAMINEIKQAIADVTGHVRR